jgi:hypothetical protein
MAAHDDAQKSEAHAVTEDASTSPLAAPERPGETRRPADDAPAPGARLIPEPPREVKVLRDETSDGGPLVIESNDPDLPGPPTMSPAP